MAIQFTHNEYTIFDEEDTMTASLICAPLSRDHINANLIASSDIFLNTPELLTQASSPKGERSHKWVKQKGPHKVILELPSLPEIIAIIKECQQYGTRNIFHLVKKWGPCMRTIVRIMARNDQDAEIEAEFTEAAMRAAWKIWTSPWSFLICKQEILDRHGSTLVFIQPKTLLSNIGLYSIPTVDLREIFDQEAAVLEKKDTLALFNAFSSHSYMRPAAGWAYEQMVTIAMDHTSPVKGLEDTFGKVKKLQPPHCQWHYVIIGEEKSTVEDLAAKASRQLQNGTDNLKNMRGSLSGQALCRSVGIKVALTKAQRLRAKAY
ncbi:hypothetical protein DFP72DRAFT_850889 [Ephemerocybe angulata]|uniref:Uncharacterized protein n=1 Tax=Ephemerocybe angulata TaxID=980116 RepID=A0A8H6M1S5_9AGAR|nr:hypothetical protein DFP72DRAFT_850889 [Tulosesus angulatus]